MLNLRFNSRGRISKKISCLGSKEEGPTTKEKVSVVDELRSEYKLCVILKAAHIAKSTYEYYKESKHLKAEEKRKSKDDEILSIVKPIYEENKSRYGYRRIMLSIDSKILSKLNVGRDRIRKVLRDNGLLGIQGRNHKYHSYTGDNGMDKRNLLLTKEVDKENHKTTYTRHFETKGPNEKWTTDVSEFKLSTGKLYLSPILDMYDSSIISYDISTSPNLEQTKRMLNEAFKQYPNLEGLIFHSDQGWQYQHQLMLV